MEQPAAPDELRPGRLQQAWAFATIIGPTWSTAAIFADVANMLRPSGVAEAGLYWGWPLFFAAQLANKAPVAYRYPLRGGLAVCDLIGYGVGMAGVAVLLLGLEVSGLLRVAGACAVLVWLSFGVALFVAKRASSTSALNAAFSGLAWFAVPGTPFAIAWLLGRGA